MISETRVYGASIALASGGYSLWSATGGEEMVLSGWLMLVLGVVVIVHGLVLLTDAAATLGDASGPLMLVYALVMLTNQALLAAGILDPGTSTGMGDGMGMDMGGSSMTGDMAWDAGMVTLALLMLVSGILMTRTNSTGESGGM